MLGWGGAALATPLVMLVSGAIFFAGSLFPPGTALPGTALALLLALGPAAGIVAQVRPGLGHWPALAGLDRRHGGLQCAIGCAIGLVPTLRSHADGVQYTGLGQAVCPPLIAPTSRACADMMLVACTFAAQVFGRGAKYRWVGGWVPVGGH